MTSIASMDSVGPFLLAREKFKYVFNSIEIVIEMQRTAADLEEIMKIKCYIMCYYPPYPDFRLMDRIKLEVRTELLKDFLDEEIITKDIYDKLIGK